MEKSKMNVRDWIEVLQGFPPDMEVRISDGFKLNFYKGNFEFVMFEDEGVTYVDIGIGGHEYED
jgi:hypothetical protein